MNNKIKLCYYLILALFIFPLIIEAQTWNVNPDYWTATDALGRTTPSGNTAGKPRSGKYVGIFYWTWRTDIQNKMKVLNISQVLRQFPEEAGDFSGPIWNTQSCGWWDEPLFGYYRSSDDWVLRKHAQMLANAGVDVVFFDCTNSTWTWKSSYMELLKVWEQARKDGVKTPQIAFILHFEACKESLSEIEELYYDLYQPGLYKDLWFKLDRKPLIMAYPEMLFDVLNDPKETQLKGEIRNFFTFRPGQPDYVDGPSRKDQWGWLEVYPQHGYGKKDGGGYEEMPVGVAQNTNDASGGHWYAFSAPGTFGRSYTKAKGQDKSSDAYFYGHNIQEQWSRAFQLDPDLVFVTGWNEWNVGRYTGVYPNMPPIKPFGFVDEYNWEKSRDIEPVKSWGDNGDNYYIQLVSNVRKFKGMQAQEPASAQKTISMGNLNDWADVKPEYLDYKGDTMWRNAPGQGDSLVYINNTGRNDIIKAKVARDTSYIYFYVETADTLTPKTDPKWMRLWIDIDRSKATGWEGYDYVINRINPGDSAVVERSINNSWNWVKAGSAEYAISGKVLQLKVKRSLLGLEGKKLNFEFKWSDNSESDGNIMDFYVNGDAAPDGRFNYIYSNIKINDLKK
jgi:hypothetical protein